MYKAPEYAKCSFGFQLKKGEAPARDDQNTFHYLENGKLTFAEAKDEFMKNNGLMKLSDEMFINFVHTCGYAKKVKL